MRFRVALVVLGAALAAGPNARAADEPGTADDDRGGGGEEAASAAATYEALAAPARPIGELGLLLGPLVDKCPDDKREREIDRVRCRASTSYLKRTLPKRTFSITTDDPAAISVSAYDEGIKGVRLGLSACLACTNPMHVRTTPEPVFVTAKKPVEAGKGDAKAGAAQPAELAAAVEVAAVNLPFASPAEAQSWLRDVRPHLRAELVFTPAATEWRFRAARGYAFTLVAGRIVDRCTGTVVLSSPPSTGVADRASAVAATAGDDRCPATMRATPAPASGPPTGPTTVEPARAPTPATAASDDDDEDQQLPSELSRTVIAEAMGKVRSQVFACYERFRQPGSVPLTYEVAANGTIQSVKLGGALNGTPTGDCVLEAARGAKFPRFDGPVQTFTYPFFLRR